MHFPVFLWLGPVPIHPHPVFEFLAYLIGGRLYAFLRGRDGDALADHTRWWVVAAAFVGATIGSKVLVLVDHPVLTIQNLATPIALVDGQTVVGALLGALIAVELAKRRLGVQSATGDLFAIPLAVGIAVGRIGCFLTGLDDNTFGVPTNLPWAIDFGDGIPRHPTQLYEIAFLLLVLLPVLVWLRDRLPREGDLFKVFMIGYLAFRLGLEFLKPGEPILGLTGIQWACVGGLLWYAHYAADSVQLRKRLPERALVRG
jgi:phosphatidylglycerol---prolipoprotein diacylglyceryl transferase